ncbi:MULTISPECIES: hypothetical protein [unclassified Halorubrum]|uniref:hypothetical protein n=1 Tax=unclassified Halorubrum TaxID=2642239 RepID=UPI0011401C48|nr:MULTISPECIES: hypothetical protein [unclassified Halorubrum]
MSPRSLAHDLVKCGLILALLVMTVAASVAPAAADHGKNHCENHGDGGVIDWLLDNFRQNQCQHGGTMTAVDAGGNSCVAGCIEPEDATER